jgi:hypothetical protein
MTQPSPRRLLTGRRLKIGDTTAAPATLQNALQVLEDAPGEIRAVLARHRDQLADVKRAAITDPNLTDAGRQAAIAVAGQRIVTTTTADVDAIRVGTDAATATLDRAAAAVVPAPQAGVEAMLARSAAWARTRSLLDSGIAVDTIISEAVDTEQLAMLTEELPTYARIQGAGPDVTLAIEYTIRHRYAELATPAQAASIYIDMSASPHEAALPPLLDSATATAGTWQVRAADLAASIESNQRFQQAQRALTGGYEDPDNDATQRRLAADSQAYGSKR